LLTTAPQFTAPKRGNYRRVFLTKNQNAEQVVDGALDFVWNRSSAEACAGRVIAHFDGDFGAAREFSRRALSGYLMSAQGMKGRAIPDHVYAAKTAGDLVSRFLEAVVEPVKMMTRSTTMTPQEVDAAREGRRLKELRAKDPRRPFLDLPKGKAPLPNTQDRGAAHSTRSSHYTRALEKKRKRATKRHFTLLYPVGKEVWVFTGGEWGRAAVTGHTGMCTPLTNTSSLYFPLLSSPLPPPPFLSFPSLSFPPLSFPPPS
jgi:hypothetical protein